MKKLLLSAFAMLLALTAGAQKFQASKCDVKLDVQKATVVKSDAKKAPAKSSVAENQRLVGYYSTDDCDAYIGATGLTGNNPVGALLSASDLAPYMVQRLSASVSTWHRVARHLMCLLRI